MRINVRADAATAPGCARARSGSKSSVDVDADVETAGLHAPLACLSAERGVLEEAAVERGVEPDALKADAGDLERADGVELARFVDVLGGCVLSAR